MLARLGETETELLELRIAMETVRQREAKGMTNAAEGESAAIYSPASFYCPSSFPPSLSLPSPAPLLAPLGSEILIIPPGTAEAPLTMERSLIPPGTEDPTDISSKGIGNYQYLHMKKHCWGRGGVLFARPWFNTEHGLLPTPFFLQILCSSLHWGIENHVYLVFLLLLFQ